jgi:hypothetical protein
MVSVVAPVALAAWFLTLHNLAGPLARRWATKRPSRDHTLGVAVAALILTAAGLVVSMLPADATAAQPMPGSCLLTVSNTHC